MKKIIRYLSPMLLCCLTMVLFINANSASCYLLNEPKAPKALNKYKIFN